MPEMKHAPSDVLLLLMPRILRFWQKGECKESRWGLSGGRRQLWGHQMIRILWTIFPWSRKKTENSHLLERIEMFRYGAEDTHTEISNFILFNYYTLKICRQIIRWNLCCSRCTFRVWCIFSVYGASDNLLRCLKIVNVFNIYMVAYCVVPFAFVGPFGHHRRTWFPKKARKLSCRKFTPNSMFQQKSFSHQGRISSVNIQLPESNPQRRTHYGCAPPGPATQFSGPGSFGEISKL